MNEQDIQTLRNLFAQSRQLQGRAAPELIDGVDKLIRKCGLDAVRAQIDKLHEERKQHG